MICITCIFVSFHFFLEIDFHSVYNMSQARIISGWMTLEDLSGRQVCRGFNNCGDGHGYDDINTGSQSCRQLCHSIQWTSAESS